MSEERGEKGRDMERRRVRIEQTEKKVCDEVLSKCGKMLTDGRCKILRRTSRMRFMMRMMSF